MQVIDEEPHSMEEKVPQDKIPAMELIEDESPKEDIIETVETKENGPIKIIRKSKQDIKEEKRKFLGREKPREKPETKDEEQTEVTDQHLDDIVSTYDGKLILQWMQTDFEDIRSKIKYCESPPISDYPEENMRIESAVNDYKTKGVYRDGDKIKDYIESLMWYGKVNPNLFGGGNYILNETIQGYKKIYDELVATKDNGEEDNALRLLSKLILVGSRPLVIDKTLMKETEYEPSISEGGVMAGTFEPEGDILM